MTSVHGNTTSSQVRVGVRIRPITPKEASEGGNSVVEGNSFDRTVVVSKRKFTFDSVFHSDLSQIDLYNNVSPSLVKAFLSGYNATILAYGQTGSGKTYTMGSEAHWGNFIENQHSTTLNDNDGLIPRFMSEIFATLAKKKRSSESLLSSISLPLEGASGIGSDDILIDFSLSASFLEVYGEDIHDLLDEDRKSLPLREDANGEVVVVGLHSTAVKSDIEAMNVLNTGTMNRTTAATLMNDTSSRSHAVFTVNLKQTIRGTDGLDTTVDSRFTFVDLAGSERMKKTGAEGERAKEGIKINEGLLALGNVINALADDERLAKGAKVHVPYRQSKLTRLLQDALGGNSQTLFLACVSPSDTNVSETISTLQYAHRARNIKNVATRNIDAAALELKRLRTLTHVLKCELVKNRFSLDTNLLGTRGNDGTTGDSPTNMQVIGVLQDDFFERDDVKAYMRMVDDKVTELCSVSSASTAEMPKPTRIHSSDVLLSNQPTSHEAPPSANDEEKSRRFSSKCNLGPDANTNAHHAEVLMEFDVNPEEDLLIIDQLLELQHHDQKFDKEQRDDQEQLDNMEGEIEAQEARLLQLRENIKEYQSMKEKYEQLMCEVHSLESEKQALAEKLERVQTDPTKGCSFTIKRQLTTVEESLARARSDARKHQQMYRKAEQEAQKCKTLERQILDLKQAKVSLIKKQREDAARHKEYTNQKTKEIQALKRKERKADKQLNRMESECSKYKANLERTRSRNAMLSDRLKQTESHLMRLLSQRRKDATRNRGRSFTSNDETHPFNGKEQFAPINKEIQSIKFLLEKTISDRVTRIQTKDAYESKLIQHGKLMQSMAKEVNRMNEKKESGDLAGIQHFESSVEELQLKIELVEAGLEELRSKCPYVEEDLSDNGSKSKKSKAMEPSIEFIAKLDGPVLRTILWSIIESFVTSEIQRRDMKIVLSRKDSALRSFENEVEILNRRIGFLSKTLDRCQKLDGAGSNKADLVGIIQKLENEFNASKARLDASEKEKATLLVELQTSRESLRHCQTEHAKTAEKIALVVSQQKLTNANEELGSILSKIQDVWADLGEPMHKRDVVRQKLGNCVEDACSRMLQEAFDLREEKLKGIGKLKEQLSYIFHALGEKEAESIINGKSQTIEVQLEHLNRTLSEVKPQYDAAEKRCINLVNDVKALCSDLDLSESELCDKLKSLMLFEGLGMKRKRFHQFHDAVEIEVSREARAKVAKQVETMMKGLEIFEETVPIGVDECYELKLSNQDKSLTMCRGFLSSSFLDGCENEIKKLRLLKSKKLLSNSDKSDTFRKIAKDMHVSVDELSSMILHSLKKRNKELPSWWDAAISERVYKGITSNGYLLVSVNFTNHLNLIVETLERISLGRKLLSDILKQVIDESHNALLSTAKDCGVDIEDLSQSLHEVLQSLPPLSRQHIKSCIDEMKMLVTAAESVAQSEIETLTVLWEGLARSSNERGMFWSGLEEMTNKIETSTASPFDHILEKCPVEMEEWVLKALAEATQVQRVLGVKLFKLKKIHKEVEQLKRRQDAKNGIMSLNNDLNMLTSKLSEFEEKAGNRKRLLDKKVNSSAMLEEERYRKQMQGVFAAKLDSLRSMLHEWETMEGEIDDTDMLSEVVRSMLQNSHRIDAWMNEKTRFMHLRTTKSQLNNTRDNVVNRERTGPSDKTFSSTGRIRESISEEYHDHKVKDASWKKESISKTLKLQSTKSRLVSSRIPPEQSVSVENKISKGHRSKSPLSASHCNGQITATLAAKKNTTIKMKNLELPEVLLPFGDILAETPSNKENR